jgi:polysaccharide biosynthesis transport protein
MKAPPSPREQLERLLLLTRRIGAYWKRGLAVFFAGAFLALPFVLTRPRAYRSETVILYQETIRSADIAGGEGSSEGSHRVGARLRELLFSRASLEPIIHDLKLYPNKIVHGESIEAVEEMRKNIVFKAQTDGDTYDISFTGASPKEAQEVTRRLGDCIIGEAAKRREEKARTLKEFLTAESERSEVALRQKEADLTRFVVLHPEYAGRLQGAPAPTTTSIAAAAAPTGDPLLASLEARAVAIERRLNGKAGPTATPKPIASFQPLPDSAELVTARHNLADKMALYTEKHPEVAAAQSRLKSAEEAQAAANAAALAAWQAQQGADPGTPPDTTEQPALTAELASLQAQIAARRSALSTSIGSGGDAGAPTGTLAPATELEFRRLQAEASDARDHQQQLEARLFRASITESSVLDDRNIQVSVLDPAYLPVRPVSKPRSLMLAGLLALSLVLAIAAMFVSAALDDRIYHPQDIERLDIPVIAIIPKPSDRPIGQLVQGAGRVDSPS